MRTKYKILLCLAALAAAVVIISFPKYLPGVDDIVDFGDGRFTMFYDYDCDGNSMGMADAENSISSFVNILDWKLCGDWLCLLDGNARYSVLNVKSGECKKYVELSFVPEDLAAQCRKLRTLGGQRDRLVDQEERSNPGEIEERKKFYSSMRNAKQRSKDPSED